MAAVLTEEPHLEEKANEIPDKADDEVEDLQAANGESTSKKKKKKKKKKKGLLTFKVRERKKLKTLSLSDYQRMFFLLCHAF